MSFWNNLYIGGTLTPILSVQNLVKKFGELTAVNGISFEIESGEIFSLLGPNGAGKTTTISILSTLMTPTSGDAVIGGHSILRQANRVREIIGIVPQEIALYEDMTALENLRFWGQMVGLSGTALIRRIHEVLEQTGLEEKADKRVKTFSGGMKRRLNIGVGLLHHPRLLFMDEPTVGIDPQSRRAILDSVKALNENGMTILYTTHYMEEAQELSDRVGIIDHGQLIALGTQQELVTQVGEKESIILYFDEDMNSAALEETVSMVPGVEMVVSENHNMRLTTPSAEDILHEVVRICGENGYKIRSLQIEEPNLEAVFLQLTGRALRD